MLGEGRDYVDWYTPESVMTRVQLHFRRGDIYITPIDAIALHLRRMKIIRNRIAHRSQAAEEKYRNLLRGLYGSPAGQKNPGFILLSRPPSAALPPTGGTTAATLFELYASLLGAAASGIVP
jgi:hypothetical protein